MIYLGLLLEVLSLASEISNLGACCEITHLCVNRRIWSEQQSPQQPSMYKFLNTLNGSTQEAEAVNLKPDWSKTKQIKNL